MTFGWRIRVFRRGYLRSVSRSTFLRNVAGTLSRQIASGLLNLCTVVLIARMLGPAGSGAYAVALLLPTLLATFLNLGVSPANVYYLASRRVDFRTSFLVTLFLSAACAFLGCSIGALLIFFLGEALFPGVGHDVLFLALAAFPFMLLLQAAGGILQGLQDFREFNLTLLVPPTVTIAAVSVLAIAGFLDLFSVTACYLLGQVLGALTIGQLLLRRPEWKEARLISDRWQYLSQLLGYGLKAYASNVVTFFNYRADLFLVNFFLGPSAAGIYVIAMQFGEKLWLLSQAVSTVFLPKVSELAGQEEERRRFTPLIARWTFLLTLLAAAALAFVFDPVVRLLAGEAFSDATWVLLLLLPGIVAWAPARVLANDIAGRGRPEINLRVAVLIIIMNSLGNCVLIPLWGLKGAAIATSIAYIANLTFYTAIYIKIKGGIYVD